LVSRSSIGSFAIRSTTLASSAGVGIVKRASFMWCADGVLFGSSNAHKKLRRMLVEEQKLDGVVSLPSGVFKPYAGVSTAILLFNTASSASSRWGGKCSTTSCTTSLYRFKLKSYPFPSISLLGTQKLCFVRDLSLSSFSLSCHRASTSGRLFLACSSAVSGPRSRPELVV
jgi:hypothetical protein